MDAAEEQPQTILSGDRNITNGNAASGPNLMYNTGTGANAYSQILQAHTTPKANLDKIGWNKEIHVEAGDLLFGDGHVDQLSSGRLRDSIRDVFANTGVNPMKLLMPNGNGSP